MLNEMVPEMRWNGVTYLPEWQKSARAKLSELLGLNEINLFGISLGRILSVLLIIALLFCILYLLFLTFRVVYTLTIHDS